MKNKIIAITTTIFLIYSMTFINVFAIGEHLVGTTTSGDVTVNAYADTVPATYDEAIEQRYDLVVTGKGAMADAAVKVQTPTINPKLSDLVPYVRSITIEEGVTNVGASAFRLMVKNEYCKEISLAESVTSIGEKAFRNRRGSDLVIDIKGKITSVGNDAFAYVSGTVKVRDEETAELIRNARLFKGTVEVVSGSDPTTAASTTAEPTTIDPTTIEPITAEPTTAEATTAEPTTVEPTTVPGSKAAVRFELALLNWQAPSKVLYINESGSYSAEFSGFNTKGFNNLGFFKYEPKTDYTGEECKISVDSIDITAADGTVYNLKLSDMYLNRDPAATSDNGLPNIWNPAGKVAGVATSADGRVTLDGGTGNGIQFTVDGVAAEFTAVKYNFTVTLASDADAPTTAEPTTAEPTAPSGAVMGDLYYADADWYPQIHDYVVIDGDGTYTFNLSTKDGDSEGAVVFVLDFKNALETNPDLKAELVSIDCNGTSLTIDQSKVRFGHIEQDKNNLRLEIYNEYGATKTDSPIDENAISFPQGTTMKVTVKISDFNGAATTAEPTTAEPTTTEPTTVEPTTIEPTETEPTEIEPTTSNDPTEATTAAEPTEETTAVDPTEATTAVDSTEETTAIDPTEETTGAVDEPTTAIDPQTTTATPATTKPTRATVAASTTKPTTATRSGGTTVSTDKTVNTGAQAAVGITIFMAAGIAGAVALKKRRK